MGEFHDAIPLANVASGSAIEVDVAGRTLAIANVKGEVFAVDNECSHMVASLADGYLDQKCFTLECPLHGSSFDLRTGEALEPPAREPIRAYTVLVENGIVKVSFDD